MSAQVQERVALPQLNNPVLVMAFSTPFKGGSTASYALGSLATQWDASLIAEIEAEECYNLGRLRPQFRRSENRTEIQWPSTQIYAATPEGSDRSFLLLVGVEPTLNWQAYASAIAQFALRAGVRTAISLRSSPASVSHRQVSTIYAWYSDELAEQQFGLPTLSTEQGPADIGVTITSCLQSLGCQTVDLFGLEPYYAPFMPVAKASLALMQAVAAPFGVPYAAGDDLDLVRQQEEALERLVAATPELRSGLQMIERQALELPSGQGTQPRGPSAGIAERESLETDEVLRDVEDLLRFSSN